MSENFGAHCGALGTMRDKKRKTFFRKSAPQKNVT
jgi:hypothetical protein